MPFPRQAASLGLARPRSASLGPLWTFFTSSQRKTCCVSPDMRRISAAEELISAARHALERPSPYGRTSVGPLCLLCSSDLGY
ncbi:hypothetical protein EYF80_053078 [Liparis tanakae]|uniref:Uncharacterized protein n=1 Tax=Liparis tanakae TaxID=230148 RepID=A0A4Z2F671_9TELE|nr:hypothetical protein EYF80_053078 [Liparis tanakae]